MVNQTCACGCGRSLAGRPAKTRFFEAKCRKKAFLARHNRPLPLELPPGLVGLPPSQRTQVTPTVRSVLEDAGRAESYLGMVALAVAERLDASDGIQGVAPIAKELRETMERALAGSQKAGRLLEMRNARKRGPAAVDDAAS